MKVKSPSRRKPGGVTVFLISLSVALLLAEGASRAFGLSKTWSSYIASRDILNEMVTEQNRLGLTRRPHVRTKWSRGIWLETNAVGFRDREFRVEKKSGVKRIGFLGDSVTEGFGLEPAERFSDQAAVLLNTRKDGARFESYNFGISGLATADENQILRNIASHYDLDCVVLQFGANDFKRNEYILSRQEKTPTSATPSPHPAENPEPSLRGWLAEHSAFYLALAERFNYLQLRNGSSKTLLQKMERKGLDATPSQWEKTRQVFKDLARFCRMKKIKLVVAYVPLDVEVLMHDKTLAYRMNDGLKRLMEELGIRFVDVLTPLRKSASADLYFDEVHLTKRGNRIIAATIADDLTANVLIN